MDKTYYAKLPCAKPGCRVYAMQDGSGFCYAHNPKQLEKRRQSQIKRLETQKNLPRLPERSCNREGCRNKAMRDGSGFCFFHNPAQAEQRKERALKIRESRLRNQPPPERRCKSEFCNSWALQDGSGLCWVHKPENISKKKKAMKGNKYAKGNHHSWLGLANIDEARGLYFFR